MNKLDLIAFEEKIEKLFEEKKIAGPIHLSDGNEEQLIEIFKDISKDDWVFSSWRNHYHALLHGIPEKNLTEQIKNGHSMSISSSEPKFMVSSIVGGCVSIATGVAYSLKIKKSSKKVWCFIGDMTAETGIYHESLKFSINNDLPIKFIIEDNQESVGSSTKLAWGETNDSKDKNISEKEIYYQYKKSKYPHVGVGKWISF